MAWIAVNAMRNLVRREMHATAKTAERNEEIKFLKIFPRADGALL